MRLRFGGLAAVVAVLIAGSGQAAVKMRMVNGRPIVGEVYVNGRGPYRFLVDTGTTMNHLDPRIAAEIGLRATFRTELTSSGGTIIVPGIEGVELAVDTVRTGGQTVLFAGLEPIQRFYPEVQGVLGQAFLSKFDYLIDVRGKKIEFGVREPEGGKIRSSFETVAGRPVVKTNLGSMVLDSGASSVTVYRLAKSTPTHMLITMTGSRAVGLVSRKLMIDGHTVWRGDVVAMPDAAEASEVGLLPVSLFKAVYVCNSGGYLVLH